METPQRDSRTRNRVTNDARSFLGNVDRRSREARRVNDVLDDLLRHLGGAEATSAVRMLLAKRASALVVWCEVEESKLVLQQEKGALPFDPQVYATAVNSLRRLLLDLGLNARLRDVTLDLHRYLLLLGDDSGDDDTIDAEALPPEPVMPVAPAEPPAPVRRDSRGRILKGTPEEVERARHMRSEGLKRKVEAEAARKAAIERALKAAKAARSGLQSSGAPVGTDAANLRLNGAARPPQPAKKPHRAAKLPPQRVKRPV